MRDGGQIDAPEGFADAPRVDGARNDGPMAADASPPDAGLSAGPSECVIDGVLYPAGAPGPGPACQTCIPEVSQTSFSACGPLVWRIAWPSGRYQAAFVPSGDGSVLLAGGDGSSGARGDALAFDGHRWVDESGPWRTLPGPRQGAVAVWDTQRARVVLLGGTTTDWATYDGATYERTGAGTWRQTVAPADGPPSRVDPGLSVD